MNTIWNFIGGNNNKVKIYYYNFECSLLCMIKKRKINKYILEYTNNELVIKRLNNTIIYVLKYIPDRSTINTFLFECKQIGGFEDLLLTIYTEQYYDRLYCEFKNTKPNLTTNITYNTYTKTYKEYITEDYNKYINHYIDKPNIILPPRYESLLHE